MAIIVAVARRGVVSRIAVSMSVTFRMPMPVILYMDVSVTFGVGGAILLFFSVGFGGLAAGEEECGEGERYE